MDIQICQCCGIIIRGKSKFCTGCGTTISKFSPVTLPVIAHTAAPLAVTLDPDPLVLERTLVKVRYSNLPAASFVPGGQEGGNGHGNGSGNGNGGQEGELDSAGQAAAASTSKLQNILGNAATRGYTGGGNGMSGLISLDADEAAEGGAVYAPEEQSAGAAPLPTPNDFAPPMPQPVAAAAPRPQQPIVAAAAPITAGPPGAVAAAPLVATAAALASAAGVATAARIVAAAGAYDALAGSTSSTIPVTVTTALSPGIDAGYVVATNLSAAPNVVPITSAEPPAGSPTASAYPNATTVVAPQTGSPEGIPSPQMTPSAQQETMPAPPNSPQSFGGEPGASADPTASLPETGAAPASLPNLFAQQPVAPADAAPDFFGGAPGSSGASVETAPPAASQPLVATRPPVSPAAAPTDSLAPPMMSPAAASPASAGGPPPVLVAPPVIPSSPSDVTPAPSTSFAAAPTTKPAAPVSTFSPIAGASSFDFFAAQGATTFPPAIAAPSAQAENPTLGGVVTPDSPKQDQNVLDPSQFGSNNGVPSVVQDAIRAAASASQTNLSPVKVMTPPTEEKPRSSSAEEFPDESVNRGKGKSDDAKAGDDSPRRRAGMYDEREDSDEKEKDKQRDSKEKMLQFGGMSLNKKKALTTIILILFIGIPGLFFIFSLFGGVLSKLGGGNSAPILGGDWEFGVLNSRGDNVKGTINLVQVGNTFTGMGVDKYGSFQIAGGIYQYPKLQFLKTYIDPQSKPLGKPIAFAGAVDWVNPDPGKGNIPFFSHMYGVWKYEKREGFGWRGQVVTRSGKWEAGQIRVEKVVDPGNITTGVGGGWNPAGFIYDMLGGKPGQPPNATVFARIAGILLLIGLGLVMASVKMFGPAGLLNIWLKKEYIPSQFKSQHYRMVNELGKGLKAGGLPLGWRADWNIMSGWLPRKLALTPEVRTTNPHMLILGAGSKGKSRLMASMIYHDIESNDRAVVVIDSDGQLIDLLMAKIASSPKGGEIARRLIIIDPTHGGDVMAYNPLEFPDDGDLQNAASAVVFGFKAIYTEPPGAQSQWNQQTANILRNSAILLMANGKTLTDLPVLLSENDFRDVLLEKVERLKNEKAEYTTLLEAWSQYKRLARTDQWINWVEPILNRVQPMLGDPRIRPILTKSKGDLNLKEIISEGKILFVKVPQGQLDQNANLLGSLIVTGLKQAALSLSLKGSSRKHPCALYLDEFDSFIEKDTYDAITSETRKFQLGFIGASKTLQSIPEDYRNQLIIKAGTMCCFALAKKDGDILGPQMFRVDGRKIKNQTLQNIFNKVNTSPQFELISDEEKLNIDRVVGQEERHYFCYRVGTVAGVFQMRAPDFSDVPDKDINWTLIDQIYARSIPKE